MTDELQEFTDELCAAAAALAEVAKKRRIVTLALTTMKTDLGRVRGRLFHQVGTEAERTAQEATDLHAKTRAAESLFAIAASAERLANDIARTTDDLYQPT